MGKWLYSLYHLDPIKKTESGASHWKIGSLKEWNRDCTPWSHFWSYKIII
jgi:hypothetical protein